MEVVRDNFLAAMPSSYEVGRKAPLQEYKETLELDGEQIRFLAEQKYAEVPEMAVRNLITLTGPGDDVKEWPVVSI